MTLQPLYDRVIIKREDVEEVTAGGIIIPDATKEKPDKGVVIATGDGLDGKPLIVKEGDVVLFAKWGGTEVTVNNEDLLIMKESDIMAIEETK